jgi:phosphate uptake regulator
MDTRKVQITGKSTYIVTLPKKWASKEKLKSGSPLSIIYNDDGSLIISPPCVEKGRDIRKIKANKNLEHLKRDIIGLYIVGDYKYIEVHGEHLSGEFRDEIKNLCNRLVGLELAESSDKLLVIQNYLDIDEFTIEKGIKRMSSIIYLMFEEMHDAFENNDRSVCKDIIKRDDDIDRLFILVSKQFVSRLSLRKFSKNDSLSLIEAFYYRLAGNDIERIGDHISKIVLHYEHTEIMPDVLSQLKELCMVLQDMFMDSLESLRRSDNLLANQLLERGEEINGMLVIVAQSADNASIDMIIDSFGRIRDYASNIAEYSIDLSQL